MCHSSGREMNRQQQSWTMILPASAGYGGSRVAHLLRPNLVSNQSGGGAILAFSSFFKQIPHQKKPEISVGIFSPT